MKSYMMYSSRALVGRNSMAAPTAPGKKPVVRAAPMPPRARHSQAEDSDQTILETVGRVAAGAALAAAVSFGVPAVQGLQALAAGDPNVGPCVVRSCGLALASCLADPTCVENLVCLQTCEGRPDKASCQVKCGDLYSDSTVQKFDTCAITENKCVPQIPDDGSYPVPPDCTQITEFKTKNFTGKWYITAGLNPLFDTFDCQAHYFTEARDGKLFGAINWRVKKENGFFYNKDAMMQFVQDEANPAHLKVSGGDFLHFSDDWYLLGSKFENGPDDYLLVYYRGNNDAWDGYGGGTLYTRAATVPEAIVPEVKAELEAAGLDWSKWIATDNSCGPEPKVLEEEVIEAEEAISKFGKNSVGAVEREIEVELAEIELDVEQELGMLQNTIKAEYNALKRTQQNLVADVRRLTSKEARLAAKDQAKAKKELTAMMTEDGGVLGMEMPSK